MKMRRVLMVLAVFAMALALYAGPVLAQQKVIKIGAVYPLTGNLASTGMDCKRGVDLAVEIINGKYDLDLPFAKRGGFPTWGCKNPNYLCRHARATLKTECPRLNV